MMLIYSSADYLITPDQQKAAIKFCHVSRDTRINKFLFFLLRSLIYLKSLLHFGTERQIPFSRKNITNKPITKTLFFFNQGHWNNFHVLSCSVVLIIKSQMTNSTILKFYLTSISAGANICSIWTCLWN